MWGTRRRKSPKLKSGTRSGCAGRWSTCTRSGTAGWRSSDITQASLRSKRAARPSRETVRRHAAGAEYTMLESNDSPAGAREAARNLLASGVSAHGHPVCERFHGPRRPPRSARGGIIRPRTTCPSPDSTTSTWQATRTPRLTTVNVPRRRIAEFAWRRCCDRMGRVGASDHSIVIDPELVVRESTGVARPVRLDDPAYPARGGIAPSRLRRSRSGIAPHHRPGRRSAMITCGVSIVSSAITMMIP